MSVTYENSKNYVHQKFVHIRYNEINLHTMNSLCFTGLMMVCSRIFTNCLTSSSRPSLGVLGSLSLLELANCQNAIMFGTMCNCGSPVHGSTVTNTDSLTKTIKQRDYFTNSLKYKCIVQHLR